MTEQKKTSGRPSKYKKIYDEQARKLCLLGAVDTELADFFEVHESTIHLWKLEHESFLEAIRLGKTTADANVANSLYNSAMGLHETVENRNGEKITKTVPPNVGAQILWLKNRQPKKWRDKVEIEAEVNTNVFPPKEELDAIYNKALSEAEQRDKNLDGRLERLTKDGD